MMPAESDGMFLHASAAVVDGGAVLFLGHSTAGKSTLVRLLAEIHPVLADDSVFVRPAGVSGWTAVAGGFRFEDSEMMNWSRASEKRRAASETAYPIRALMRLHKSRGLRTEAMDEVERARCLMDAVLEIDIQRRYGRPSSRPDGSAAGFAAGMKMRRIWFRQAAALARSCPGWRLWFSRGESPAPLAETIGRLVSSVPAPEIGPENSCQSRHGAR